MIFCIEHGNFVEANLPKMREAQELLKFGFLVICLFLVDIICYNIIFTYKGTLD
jgi:nitrate reductase NapE component